MKAAPKKSPASTSNHVTTPCVPSSGPFYSFSQLCELNKTCKQLRAMVSAVRRDVDGYEGEDIDEITFQLPAVAEKIAVELDEQLDELTEQWRRQAVPNPVAAK